MAFRQCELGLLLALDPPKAFKKLVPMFKRTKGSVSALAAEIGVDRTTLFRWLTRLEEAGLGDPRGGERGQCGRPAQLR